MSQRKKILYNSDLSIIKTGLGKNSKNLLTYLYKTGKYEIVHYACGQAKYNLEFARFPYKVIGTLPNDPREFAEIQKDPIRSRDASYGSSKIDEVIKEEKPDLLIFSNDSWAFPYTERIWWDKIPSIFHVTLDSTPFLPEQKKLIEKSKYFYVWADFAEKEAHRLGYKHVKTLTGIIDPNNFFKISKREKESLRKKHGIPNDAFIVGYVFRNQLRKELPALIKGYKIFKQQNPEIKNAYLLLHTSWTEGWDINRLCQEEGVDLNDVLTTYICRNCLEIDVKSYKGHDLDCPYCKVKGDANNGQLTCNVSAGCTEEQLNSVYNLMDFYIHPMNCGGLEIPMCESLYAEVPIATVDYSSGSMFCSQLFVSKIDFSWTTQIGTQFNRAAPYPSSIAKLMKKFYYMDQKERDELGKSGRNWALKTFSPYVVCKQWENIIDSIPGHNWDFNFSTTPKNPQAIILDNIESDEEFIITLYDKILNMKVDKSDSGASYWLDLLSKTS